jgi:TatD DNase family protein
MNFIDTHTHLYLEEFAADREDVILRSIDSGVTRMLLPNIDSGSVNSLLELCGRYPANCLPMMGVHPTSVKQNFRDELSLISDQLSKLPGKFCAIGEIGIDLYWDKTHQNEQAEAFRIQLGWAKQHGLPVAIHTRNSFDIVAEILEESEFSGITGVFHCFGGNIAQAKRAIHLGFYLGIGGVITYKNSGLQAVVAFTGLKHLLLETDAPFLPPVPYRGQRNESSYVPVIAQKIAEMTNTNPEEVAEITTSNARSLFKIN